MDLNKLIYLQVITCDKIKDLKWLTAVQFVPKWFDFPHKKCIRRWEAASATQTGQVKGLDG